MKRPYWRTLAWRLTLAFVLVSAAALGTVGFISSVYTRSEFSALLGAQAQESLTAQVQAYVQANGTVSGFRPSEPHPRNGDRAGPPPRTPGVSRSSWLVLDEQRRAVFSTPNVPRGTRVPRPQGTPVTVGNRVVAYLIPSGMRPRPDRRGEDFLSRTAQAIGWSMLGATVLAVVMGLLVSRTLLRPLSELRRGIRALQRGDAPIAHQSTRTDEFGEVLHAFGEMHQDVVRSQQARRQLTADIAHDLNTPLAVISGTLEAILDGTFKPTSERLKRLHQETQHVSQLVNDLRFLSLADAGELHMNHKLAEVEPFIRGAVATFEEMARQGDVTLETHLKVAGVRASVDVVRITQVLQNLLSNALAHTSAGGRVVVTAEVAGQSLTVSVKDTGDGIQPEHLPHVFNRLYRADQARSGGGSGLGLSICKTIVEAHGGDIRITSAVGSGTTVTFTLPLPPALS
ncbi:ATP-binding protein [Deinococcus deserti]|uniref:histidine kinase n=1 Tax=Deinococcus deserti (strain DSM 17065 / CIP 109153 / LMG 22923 / VCD115) TaxID=546414 RepID=C1D255_DEIDV|nr:ATP-binding protein [Deinococcus deserti]ACO47494.1 putative histidine kinase, classic [Deinococcus deserti VCD115]